MASTAHTTRRSLFAITGGIAAAVAVPAAAQAVSADPWDALLTALRVMDPRLAEQGELARQQGFEPQQLHLVMRSSEGPMLVFRKTVNGVNGPYVFDGAASGGLN